MHDAHSDESADFVKFVAQMFVQIQTTMKWQFYSDAKKAYSCVFFSTHSTCILLSNVLIDDLKKILFTRIQVIFKLKQNFRINDTHSE